MITPNELSEYEKCARLPQLSAKWEPQRWPVRDAVKRYIAERIGDDPEIAADDFLLEAANRGYLYPEGEPYELAKDYASWIDSALRLLAEGPRPDVVRVVSDLGDRRLRWPELVKIAVELYPVVEIVQIKLPPTRKHRLLSPLSLVYCHPMTGEMRLARVDKEQKAFSNAWERIGRWERPEISWQEWRAGIDRDRCMDQIMERYTVTTLGYQERQKILNDIEHISVSIDKPLHPRKWEACENCIFNGYCHGDKSGYDRKTVLRSTLRREDQTPSVFSQGFESEGRQI